MEAARERTDRSNNFLRIWKKFKKGEHSELAGPSPGWAKRLELLN
jgi:hypothetical protein